MRTRRPKSASRAGAWRSSSFCDRDHPTTLSPWRPKRVGPSSCSGSDWRSRLSSARATAAAGAAAPTPAMWSGSTTLAAVASRAAPTGSRAMARQWWARAAPAPALKGSAGRRTTGSRASEGCPSAKTTPAASPLRTTEASSSDRPGPPPTRRRSAGAPTTKCRTSAPCPSATTPASHGRSPPMGRLPRVIAGATRDRRGIPAATRYSRRSVGIGGSTRHPTPWTTNSRGWAICREDGSAAAHMGSRRTETSSSAAAPRASSLIAASTTPRSRDGRFSEPEPAWSRASRPRATCRPGPSTTPAAPSGPIRRSSTRRFLPPNRSPKRKRPAGSSKPPSASRTCQTWRASQSSSNTPREKGATRWPGDGTQPARPSWPCGTATRA